ncbi:hypothetical protein ACFPES_15035 [Paenibacillus sp. GCM10023248]|uniref:hypothetical protein n=1 Tax=unclassified Paenibacillus TaxID=185978 RepID=UPI0023780B39|nr:hypothetical protein [Paenibacillus sp. MAHUQ-63]MDD9268353.1 hypothetical protein [Paenibacillus sp. MAHUQ-63]
MADTHNPSSNHPKPGPGGEHQGLISQSLEENELMLQNSFVNCYDIAMRHLRIFGQIRPSILLRGILHGRDANRFYG